MYRRAVRKNRYNIIQSDLEDAYSSQVKGGNEAGKFTEFNGIVKRQHVLMMGLLDKFDFYR